jgi:RNA exonuclease 4
MGGRTKDKARRLGVGSTQVTGVNFESQVRQSDTEGASAPSLRKKSKKRKKKSHSTEDHPAKVGGNTPGTTNWDILKATISTGKRKKLSEAEDGKHRTGESASEVMLNVTSSEKIHEEAARTIHSSLTKVLALDCEMVGSGPGGVSSILARVSIVNSSGDLVYDTFVSPTEKITDYRTPWSGIRAKDLVGAPPKSHVVDRVKAIVRGRVLVGHALQNDLDALGLSHPESHIRDSAHYPDFMRRLISGKLKPRALRLIVAEELNLTIQTGEHDSVQDARAVLGLYNKHKTSWEAWHAKEMKRRLKRKRK